MKIRTLTVLLLTILCVSGCTSPSHKYSRTSSHIGTIESIQFSKRMVHKRNPRIAIIDSSTNLTQDKAVFNKSIPANNTTHADQIVSIIKKYGPKSSIVDVYAAGTTTITESGVYRALTAIKSKDYDLVNMSFYFESISQRIQNIILELMNDSTVVVAAAGNHSREYSDFPARLPGVLSIGAVESTGLIADYSNFGDVDYVMPGTLYSNLSRSKISGTSISCALATSFIARLYESKKYTRREVMQALRLYSVVVEGEHGSEYRQLTFRSWKK